jgi:hypothetical protein
MATVKLRKLDPSSAGITIPVDELRREGIVVSEPGEPIELAGEQLVHVDRQGNGEWKISLACRELPASASD